MKKPDIILRGIEAPLVGKIKGLRGKTQVERVIAILLGDKRV